MNVKKVLAKYIHSIRERYAILLSSGVDSRALFFESIEQDKDFCCYTFRMDGIYSTDFLEARELCEVYGIDHHEVILPSDIDTLISDIHVLKSLGAVKKTEYECFWPFLYIYKAVTERVIVSGLGADGHFCISKKACIHYKDKPDDYRKLLFENPGYCQAVLHKNYNEGKSHIVPYLSREMISESMGTTWDEVNKPKQKYPIIKPYLDHFNKIKVYKHQNFQLGDSGISEHFKKLLDTKLNTGNFKSVISIFNRLKTTEDRQQSLFDLEEKK